MESVTRRSLLLVVLVTVGVTSTWGFPSRQSSDDDEQGAFRAARALGTLCRTISYPLLRLTGVNLCSFLPVIPDLSTIDQGTTETLESIASTTVPRPAEVVATSLPPETMTAEVLYERLQDACDQADVESFHIHDVCYILVHVYAAREYGLYLQGGELLIGFGDASARRVTFPEVFEAMCAGQLPSLNFDGTSYICYTVLFEEVTSGPGSGDGEAGSGDEETGSGDEETGSGDGGCGSGSDMESTSYTPMSVSDGESSYISDPYYRSYAWSVSDDDIYF